MEFKSFLVKYGEIGVKGKNRFKFEDALIHQIRLALRKTEGNFEIVREHSGNTEGSMWTWRERTITRIPWTR